MRLEAILEFKYLISVLDESGIHSAKCHKKVASRKKIVCATRLLVNARGLQFECARLVHEALLVPVLMYGNETLIFKEKERSRIRAVQTDSLRILLGIKRMGKLPNALR